MAETLRFAMAPFVYKTIWLIAPHTLMSIEDAENQ